MTRKFGLKWIDGTLQLTAKAVPSFIIVASGC